MITIIITSQSTHCNWHLQSKATNRGSVRAQGPLRARCVRRAWFFSYLISPDEAHWRGWILWRCTPASPRYSSALCSQQQMTGTAAPTRYRRRPAASTSHTSVVHGENQLRGLRHRSRNPDWGGGLLFPPVNRISQQNEESKTPHFRFWYVHLIVIVIIKKKTSWLSPPPLLDNKIENNPAGPDFPARPDPLKGGQLCSSTTCPAHAAVLPSVRGRTKCAGEWRAEESGAHKGRARTGCDFSCLHPGARTVLCLHASAVMSNPAH